MLGTLVMPLARQKWFLHGYAKSVNMFLSRQCGASGMPSLGLVLPVSSGVRLPLKQKRG